MTEDIAIKLGDFFMLILSLSFHEYAHALAAKLLGDSTAARLGRLSLHPVVHLDPIGSVLLPLAAIFSNGMLFGWAKPVPVNLSKLRFQHVGYGIVASAGPLANLILSLLCLLALRALEGSGLLATLESTGISSEVYLRILSGGVTTNAILAFFNLVPIPPLDGGGIAAVFMPKSLREPFTLFFQRFGMIILVVLMLTGGLNWVNRFAAAYIDALVLVF